MSNEFDKEVAAKIAEKSKGETYGEFMIKRNDYMDEIWKNSYEYKDGYCSDLPLPNNVESGDLMMATLDWGSGIITFKDTDKKGSIEMNKIDFYRQKVQQYEAIENLISSIECELEDIQTALSELRGLEEDVFSRKAHLSQAYKDTETTYQSCLTCLKDLLKRL